MDVGYVQFAALRSCGKGKLPIELAGVGVVSQSSPPLPPELLLEPPLDEPVLEPPPEPLLELPLLELLAPPLPVDEPPPLLELAPASPAEDGSPGFGEVAQAARPRNPMKTEGRV